MALVAAPDEGIGSRVNSCATGWTRTTLYRHLREYVEAGTCYPGQPGTVARPDHRGAVTVSDRLDGCPVPPPRARVCT